MPSSHKVVVIMFTDMVGYTALMEQDEKKALTLLRKNKEIHQLLFDQFNGNWLKKIGDGNLASFHSTLDAVYCGGQIIKQAEQIEGLNLSIGIHLGEVITEGGEIYGDGVNVASRIESIAQKDQILITESIYKNIRYKEGIETAFQGEQKFKNLTDPFKVYSVKVNKIPSEYFDQTPTSITAEKTKKNRSLILVSSIVILLLLGYFLGPQILSGITQNTITGKSIAVLSFLDMSPNGDQEYLGDGIAEEILNLSTLHKV